MSDRYFVENPITSSRATITGAEAHHLIHVKRAAPGVRVTLFDGGGDEFQAVVERVGRAEVELAVLVRERVDRELPFDLTLGVALPKGERQRWLVEKAVELGVTRVVPLVARRSVAQPADSVLARLRRVVVEASKQCGRNRLMRIDAAQTWPQFAAEPAEGACRLLAQPGGDYFLGHAGESVSPIVRLAVGPEGGWDDAELALAIEAGWRRVNLGPRTLRVETAAILLAARVVGEIGAKPLLPRHCGQTP